MRLLILSKAIHSYQISPFLLMSPDISNIEATFSQVSQQQDNITCGSNVT